MRSILGLDLGTSGLRGCISADGHIIAQAKATITRQTPDDWDRALRRVLSQLSPQLAQVGHIIADATSSTVMLGKGLRPISPVRLYADAGHPACAARLSESLPEASGAAGASSTLCKVLQLKAGHRPHGLNILHQIDWLNGWFLGHPPATDWNNALKLGFDPVELRWPETIRALLHPLPTPRVVPPGTALGEVSALVRKQWGFPAHCAVHAGTTDSIAAFLASGAHKPGDAVTSLGSTLAIKLLSERPVFSSRHGVYSHRLPMGWLAGGASNAGGQALLRHFSLAELRALSAKLDIDHPTGLDYYPLPGIGERFPINDSQMKPRLEPIPEDRAHFLQGMLEGLVNIEAMGYERLTALGATPPRRIFCAGGGCANGAWQALRARHLPAELAVPLSGEAAFGVTRLLDGAPT